MRLLLGLVLLVGCSVAHAAGFWFTGSDVYGGLRGCEQVADARGANAGEASGEEMRLARECLLTQGYVQGVSDAIARNPAFALSICIADKTTAVDLWNVVYEWMAAHPERLGEPAPVVLEQALEASWPCAVRQQ